MLQMDWLPKSHDVDSYILSCLTLLDEWKWLYEERNTDILKTGLLDKTPASNVIPYISKLSVDELNEVPFGFVKDDWPEFIKAFVKQCCSLKLNIRKYELGIHSKVEPRFLRKMSPKKREEVVHLSSLTAEICQRNNIKHVVDFGSGLGYVDRILNQVQGLSVLGLEKDANKVRKAKGLESGVTYQEIYITEDNIPEVMQVIDHWLMGSPACFIALHGCGDLSIQIRNLYHKMEAAEVLILIPCCYHRSTLRPLSPGVKKSGLINTTLLRLASDSTAERWRLTSQPQHSAHARSVLARALIQIFPSDDSLEIKKNRRHLLRTVSGEKWGKCLVKCMEGFSGIDIKKLQEVWDSNEWRLDQIEAFTCLQVCLQATAEGLVLADTFLFLKENIKANVNLIRLFDVIISPRSVAFIVER